MKRQILSSVSTGRVHLGFAALVVSVACLLAAMPVSAQKTYLSPGPIVAAPNGALLYIAETGANQIAVWDVAAGFVAKTYAVPAPPTGLALSTDGARLLVTCAAPAGSLCVLDAASGAVSATIPVGYGAADVTLAPDGALAFVCNAFENSVSVVDLAAGKETGRIAVSRQPVAAAISADGVRLFVANLLPPGRSDLDVCAAVVSVIDVPARAVAKEIPLPNGSGSVQDICLSPDGKYAFAVHLLSRFHMPTTQLERGWMNTNALTVIDAAALAPVNTVLLDDVDRGAANPWNVACSADGKLICVTHAGSHELSVIDAAGLLAKLAAVPATAEQRGPVTYPAVAPIAAEVPNDLTFLVGLRRRIALDGNSPRGVVIAGNYAFVPMYFTCGLNRVDLTPDVRKPVTNYALGTEPAMTDARKGEMFFADAQFCFQNWQSCVSCHPDARADALNWDLLNDGIGNPKNTKSMLLAHKTPPAMSLGVRDKAETAVRSGLKFIQFTVRPEADACAIDEYLKQLQPVPSPKLVNGQLSEAALRGKALFEKPEVGCAECHPAPLYTDLKTHDAGTRGPLDREDAFDTPTLVETWRTAPYLHDGRSVTLMDVLTKDNAAGKHGVTANLSPQQLEDLAEFVLSL